MEKFELASRQRVRFGINGNSTAEDLWDLSKETLAEYEAKLIEAIEKQGKRNRFAKKDNVNALNELRLSIVSHIIDVKVAEEEESTTAYAKKQEREKLLAILAKKQDEALTGLSVEELQAKLASL